MKRTATTTSTEQSPKDNKEPTKSDSDDDENYDECWCGFYYRVEDNQFIESGDLKNFPSSDEKLVALKARCERRGDDYFVCVEGTLHRHSIIDNMEKIKEEEDSEAESSCEDESEGESEE